MAEVRRRPAKSTSTTAPARRRDRVRPVEEDEEEDVDATARRVSTKRRRPAGVEVRSRRSTAPVEDDEEDEEEDEDDEEEETPRRRTTTAKRRRPDPEEDEDEEDDEDEDEEDEDDEEEEPPARSRRKTSARKPAARSRAARDDDDDEEPAPRRRSSKTSTRRKTNTSGGVESGLAGVDKVRKSGGANVDRVKLSSEPVLIKILDSEPFATYRQHWVPQGRNKPDRPYTCIGKDTCPLCEMGDRAGQVICFNVLDLSTEGEPKVKMLQMGITAFEALKSSATPRGKDKPNFRAPYFAVSRSGKGQQSSTNFRLVKERDLEEDWPEVSENYDLDELKELIEESEADKFDKSIIEKGSPKQLAEVARYLADDDAEDDDDDD